MAHRRRQSELTQDAVTEAMSSLELGIPERVARASARADGAKTPTPVQVASVASVSYREAHTSLPTLSERTEAVTIEVQSPTLEAPNSPSSFFPTNAGTVEPAAAAAASGSAQKVTPWDVEGATIDGKQVRSD